MKYTVTGRTTNEPFPIQVIVSAENEEQARELARYKYRILEVLEVTEKSKMHPDSPYRYRAGTSVTTGVKHRRGKNTKTFYG